MGLRLTPLHLAAHEGYTRIIERLIGYGADPNVADTDGNTPLNVVIANSDTVKAPSDDCPQTQKVCYRRTITKQHRNYIQMYLQPTQPKSPRLTKDIFSRILPTSLPLPWQCAMFMRIMCTCM